MGKLFSPVVFRHLISRLVRFILSLKVTQILFELLLKIFKFALHEQCSKVHSTALPQKDMFSLRQFSFLHLLDLNLK